MVHEQVICENVFTGENETVDLYFHLTEAEVAMLDLGLNQQYSNFEQNRGDHDAKTQIYLFEKLIEKAYGQRTPDGQFVKDETKTKAFLCSPAYSEFLRKFINEEIKVQDFILGCLPKKISKQMEIKEDGTVSIKQ